MGDGLINWPYWITLWVMLVLTVLAVIFFMPERTEAVSQDVAELKAEVAMLRQELHNHNNTLILHNKDQLWWLREEKR